MTTITINGGVQKSVQAGDQLICVLNYLPPGNEDQAIIVSFDGDGNPQANIVIEGASPMLVSIAQNQILEVWRQI